ncbi:MAG: class I SAM-dependent methyltransferase [Vicinamibacteria bacterium]
MDVFFEIHRGLPQEGPGSDAATLEALSCVGPLPTPPRILDIGCGPGRQTLCLAEKTGGHITAVDTHQPYLDELLRRAKEKGIADRITAVRRSMDALSFEEGTFDLIWAEGSIYVMGFAEGLRDWRRFLRLEGAMVVTELCWLVDSPPEEARSFFQVAYPAMRSVAENTHIINKAGYSIIAVFLLPESAWWDDYYTPMEERISDLKRRYVSEPAILETLREEQKEIDLYRRYSNAYGYVFFIMSKNHEQPCTTT